MSKKRRCAIYTRKSTEDGLEQDFNSLDAQRQACEAFIQSQKSEGWSVVRKRYDDGGYSGGSMERPALQALLEDIEHGKVDVIVVYKVDRLTRALADFARIVDLLDGRGVSFVSVTQQFNTTSSMGRLTLNVLLSFAQFEREVTAERIRDKIAASKKKGMWMGGLVPLGYDAQDRSLAINKEEARTVRTLFDLYLKLDHVRALKQVADRSGFKTKVRTCEDGMQTGGCSFSRGRLYHLLRNPIYIGKIRHKDEVYEGLHDAIITMEIWDRVQKKLSAGARRSKAMPKRKSSSILIGRLFDETGEAMTTNHAVKQGKRYRYYISKCLNEKQPDSHTGWRLPADEIEGVIAGALRNFLSDPIHVMEAFRSTAFGDGDAVRLSASLTKKPPSKRDLKFVLQRAVQRIDISRDNIRVSIDFCELAEHFGFENSLEREDTLPPIYQLTIATQMRRRGVEAKIVLGGDSSKASAQDKNLIELIAKTHHWFAMIKSGEVNSINELADKTDMSAADVSRLLPLAFLSPDIVESILAGRQPVNLTAQNLKRLPHLAIDWNEQGDQLGFASQSPKLHSTILHH
jgi:site-specific DNA recombinase